MHPYLLLLWHSKLHHISLRFDFTPCPCVQGAMPNRHLLDTLLMCTWLWHKNGLLYDMMCAWEAPGYVQGRYS